MRTAVAGNKDAIGYISFGYIDNTVQTVKINGVEATVDNVISGSYPVSRPFLMITKGEVSEAGKAFIDYFMGNDGQKLAEEEGYILVK